MLKQTNKQTLIIIYLFILVAPMIWIPNQLIGAAIGNPDVTLECITEAMPKAIAYWVFNGTMVMTAGRYKTHEHHHSNYKLDLKLHIKNVQEEDYGMYKCLSKNSHGDNEGSIQLYSEIIFVYNFELHKFFHSPKNVHLKALLYSFNICKVRCDSSLLAIRQ